MTLDDFRVPGAKAAVGSILLIVKRIDVRLYSTRTRRLTMCYRRQAKRAEKSCRHSSAILHSCVDTLMQC